MKNNTVTGLPAATPFMPTLSMRVDRRLRLRDSLRREEEESGAVSYCSDEQLELEIDRIMKLYP
jgi:hypothetical protein